MGFLGMNSYQIKCLVYVCFGASFYGYDSGITSSVLAYGPFLKYFNLNNTTIGAFNSAYYAACAVGTALNWYLPNKLGRLRSIQVAAVISVLGIVLQTASQNFGMFVAGRILGGIACGIMFALCPVYAAEIAPPKLRGRIGAFYALNISISYMITEWFGLAFYFLPGNTSWRLLFGLQFVPGTMMFIGSFWMPESPRWLALVDRYEECEQVLKDMHGGTSSDHDEHFYQREFYQIKAQIEQDKAEKLGLKDIFTRKSYARRVGLIMLFFFAQQCTGIIPLSNYQVFIYQTIGFTPVMALVFTGVWGTVSTFAVLTLGFFFDKIGRRNALFMSYSIMIPAGAIIVGLWSAFEASGNTNLAYGKGVIFGIFLTCFGFSPVMNTFGPVYGAEIMPTNIRAAGVACGYFTFNAMIILLVQTTPLALAAISWKFFLIFLILDCVYVVIVYFFYPETKNKTLEEIEGVFGDAVAVTMEETERKFSVGGASDVGDEKATEVHVDKV